MTNTLFLSLLEALLRHLMLFPIRGTSRKKRALIGAYMPFDPEPFGRSNNVFTLCLSAGSGLSCTGIYAAYALSAQPSYQVRTKPKTLTNTIQRISLLLIMEKGSTCARDTAFHSGKACYAADRRSLWLFSSQAPSSMRPRLRPLPQLLHDRRRHAHSAVLRPEDTTIPHSEPLLWMRLKSVSSYRFRAGNRD